MICFMLNFVPFFELSLLQDHNNCFFTLYDLLLHGFNVSSIILNNKLHTINHSVVHNCLCPSLLHMCTISYLLLQSQTTSEHCPTLPILKRSKPPILTSLLMRRWSRPQLGQTDWHRVKRKRMKHSVERQSHWLVDKKIFELGYCSFQQ